jgi:hypothetical protein
MAKGGQPAEPPPTGVGAILRLGVVGCLSFLGCFVLGAITTAIVTECALRDVPRAEVYEALYRDGLAMQWTCGGWVASLAASALVAVVAVLWARGGRA